jgi:hypothetical protein
MRSCSYDDLQHAITDDRPSGNFRSSPDAGGSGYGRQPWLRHYPAYMQEQELTLLGAAGKIGNPREDGMRAV